MCCVSFIVDGSAQLNKFCLIFAGFFVCVCALNLVFVCVVCVCAAAVNDTNFADSEYAVNKV